MADGPARVEQLKRQLKERDETNRCLAARIAELEAEAKIRHTIKVQPHINDALDQVDEALRDVLPWGEYQQAVDVLIKLRKS
jgi:hypothetical protein